MHYIFTKFHALSRDLMGGGNQDVLPKSNLSGVTIILLSDSCGNRRVKCWICSSTFGNVNYRSLA